MTNKPQFPSQPVVDAIKAGVPNCTADISAFIDKTPEEIVTFVMAQEGAVTINLSNANPQERANFAKANELLKASGAPLINLFDDKQRTAEITRQISAEVIEKAAASFRRMIVKILRESPGDLVTEYNTYTAPRGAKLGDLHYWDNVGIAKGDGLRNDVGELFADTVMTEFEFEREDVMNAFRARVLPQLAQNPALANNMDQVMATLLGMFSNMVRGVLYAISSPSKVAGYKLRQTAVDALREDFEIAQ
ncbi:MAG: hypothetical protein WCT53_01355 [Candidatus Gracilibacteria bacterium]